MAAAAARACVGLCGSATAADVLADAQVFLQRFGIEPMLPNGQRVSTLATEGARERATARCSLACCVSHLSRARPNAGGRGVHQLRTSRPQLPHDAGKPPAHCGSQQQRARTHALFRRARSYARRTRAKPCSLSASRASTSGPFTRDDTRDTGVCKACCERKHRVARYSERPRQTSRHRRSAH